MSKDKLNLIELKIGDELFSVLKEINSRTKIPLTKIVISILNEKLQDIKELNYNKEFIEDSNDSVYYFIFGKTLSSIDLSKYLNEKGNTSMVSDNDWRFQGITALLDTRMIVGLLLFLISYTSILMANIIINLKKQGVQRLAGISCFRLSFLGLKKRLTYIFITTIITLLTSSLILYIINLRRIMYFYVIIFPTIFIVLVLLLIELIVGILVYLFLQRQKINLVIKDMAPIRALMSFVFLLQLISLLCLIFSFSSISSSHKDWYY